MPKLKSCPFCGCSIEIRKFIYPNGDEGLEPYGFHDSWCVLDGVLWSTYPEYGWTEDKLAEAWNRRWEKGDSI